MFFIPIAFVSDASERFYRKKRLRNAFLHVQNSFSYVRNSTAQVPQSISHRGNSISHVRNSISQGRNSISHVLKSISHVPQSISDVPKSRGNVPQRRRDVPPRRPSFQVWPMYQTTPLCLRVAHTLPPLILRPSSDLSANFHRPSKLRMSHTDEARACWAIERASSPTFPARGLSDVFGKPPRRACCSTRGDDGLQNKPPPSPAPPCRPLYLCLLLPSFLGGFNYTRFAPMLR